MRPRRSLRNKIFLAMLLAGLIPLMGGAWFFAMVTDRLIQDQALEDIARSGELARTLMDERGERLLTAAQSIAVSPLVRDAVLARDRPALMSLPWVRLPAGPRDFTITITDAQGTVLLRSFRPDRWGDSFYDELYGLRNALNGRPGYTTELAGTRGLALRWFGPIESDGQVVGAVIATQNIDREFRLSLSQRIELDTLFAYPDGTTSGIALDPALARSIVSSGQTFNGIAQIGGRDQVIHAWPVVEPDGDVDGYLGVVFPLDHLEAARAQWNRAGALVAATVIVASIALGWLLSRTLLVPLESITRAATRIAGGESQEIPKIRSGDELEQLSTSLGTMVASLTEQTRRLAEVNAALAESSRLKSEFLANMSHELRTPLNAIIGFSELLLDEPPGGEDPETRKIYLSSIHNSGRHLLTLINDVLDLSKVEAGKMELYREPFLVADVVGEVLQTVEPLAARKNINLVEETGDGGQVVADAGRIKQILYNLLSNAIKFTPDGGRVTVSAHRTPDTVHITVADTGIGISPEDQAALFQEFHQLDSGLARRYEGSGLGLALTKRLVELHCGEIWVESEVGKGSRFHVSLPVGEPERVETVAEPLAPTPIEADTSLDASAEPPLVLVVEDDPDAAELIGACLRRGGYRCEVATDGLDAILKAEALRPMAITLDIMLPRIDGWGVLRSLKSDQRTRDIPVAIVSVVENEQLGSALGAADYFVKPVERQALLARIEAYDSATRRRPMCALVIDDDPKVLELMASTVTKAGFGVISAVGADDGVAIASQDRPDLILLDVSSPSGRGYEVATALKDNPATADVPLLVVNTQQVSSDGGKSLRNQLTRALRRRAERRSSVEDGMPPRESVRTGATGRDDG